MYSHWNSQAAVPDIDKLSSKRSPCYDESQEWLELKSIKTPREEKDVSKLGQDSGKGWTGEEMNPGLSMARRKSGLRHRCRVTIEAHFRCLKLVSRGGGFQVAGSK
jgi:hypothetical protein